MQNNTIDFNIDLTTPEVLDSELLEYASSISLPCLVPYVKPIDICRAMDFCSKKRLAFGALVQLDENENPTDEELEALVRYQVGALWSLAHSMGYEIEYVRPAGQLYKMANESLETATIIVRAMKKVNKWLVYYGGKNEITAQVGENEDIRVVSEIQLGKNTEESIKRLKSIVETPQGIESVHFTVDMPNALELMKQAADVMKIQPASYNKVELSGWL